MKNKNNYDLFLQEIQKMKEIWDNKYDEEFEKCIKSKF